MGQTIVAQRGHTQDFVQGVCSAVGAVFKAQGAVLEVIAREFHHFRYGKE